MLLTLRGCQDYLEAKILCGPIKYVIPGEVGRYLISHSKSVRKHTSTTIRYEQCRQNSLRSLDENGVRALGAIASFVPSSTRAEADPTCWDPSLHINSTSTTSFLCSFYITYVFIYSAWNINALVDMLCPRRAATRAAHPLIPLILPIQSHTQRTTALEIVPL